MLDSWVCAFHCIHLPAFESRWQDICNIPECQDWQIIIIRSDYPSTNLSNGQIVYMLALFEELEDLCPVLIITHRAPIFLAFQIARPQDSFKIKPVAPLFSYIYLSCGFAGLKSRLETLLPEWWPTPSLVDASEPVGICLWDPETL